jgi:ParB/Sulfiredoxin domain
MTAATPTPETIVQLRLAEVHPAADNVRADVGDVTELAASIKAVGVLEPLIVTQAKQPVIDDQPAVARIAAELLDVKAKDRDGQPSFKAFVTGPARVEQLAYALGLAAGEQPFAQLVAQSYFDEEFSSHAARYFAHLKAAGYKAVSAETEQIKASGWRPAWEGGAK